MDTEDTSAAAASSGDMDILRTLADGGAMEDYSQWPSVLATLLSHLTTTAHTTFPIPNLPPPPAPPAPAIRPPALQPAPSSSPQLIPVPSSSPPPQPTPSATQETIPSSSNKENADPLPPLDTPPAPESGSTLPAQLSAMLEEITSTLTTNFPTKPPHTIQRLAELVIAPRAHYKTLAAYLHALDRVVHVTSSADTYPLPPAIISVPQTNGESGADGGGGSGVTVSWANPTTTVPVGSDEALGGALLTPIPWLNRTEDAEGEMEDDSGSMGGAQRATIRSESTETIEGPNGMGSIETVSVSVNGIPSTGAGTRSSLSPSSASTETLNATPMEFTGPDEEEELPHTRGPEEIGAEDLGPQPEGMPLEGVSLENLDLEAAVGQRPRSSKSPEVTRPSRGGDSDDADAMETDDAPDESTEKAGTKREAEEDPEGAEAVVKKAKEDAGSPESTTLTEGSEAVEKEDVKMKE